MSPLCRTSARPARTVTPVRFPETVIQGGVTLFEVVFASTVIAHHPPPHPVLSPQVLTTPSSQSIPPLSRYWVCPRTASTPQIPRLSATGSLYPPSATAYPVRSRLFTKASINSTGVKNRPTSLCTNSANGIPRAFSSISPSRNGKLSTTSKTFPTRLSRLNCKKSDIVCCLFRRSKDTNLL